MGGRDMSRPYNGYVREIRQQRLEEPVFAY